MDFLGNLRPRGPGIADVFEPILAVSNQLNINAWYPCPEGCVVPCISGTGTVPFSEGSWCFTLEIEVRKPASEWLTNPVIQIFPSYCIGSSILALYALYIII
jgi:hypothetical protein